VGLGDTLPRHRKNRHDFDRHGNKHMCYDLLIYNLLPVVITPERIIYTKHDVERKSGRGMTLPWTWSGYKYSLCLSLNPSVFTSGVVIGLALVLALPTVVMLSDADFYSHRHRQM